MNSQDADLRDIFAAMALQGLLSNSESPCYTPNQFADEAYRMADAMLRKREERSDD
jgi:hypothetical protein